MIEIEKEILELFGYDYNKMEFSDTKYFIKKTIRLTKEKIVNKINKLDDYGMEVVRTFKRELLEEIKK